MPIYDRMFAILREEAKGCGFELRLDGLEATVAYKKEMQKQHEMAFGSWLITAAGAGFPPVPAFHQRLRRKGQPQAADQQHLRLGPRRTPTRSANKSATRRTAEELKDAAWKLQHIIHDEAIFVPGFSVDFIRIGSWRWVRWPDCETTRFSPPVVYDPHEVVRFLGR